MRYRKLFSYVLFQETIGKRPQRKIAWHFFWLNFHGNNFCFVDWWLIIMIAMIDRPFNNYLSSRTFSAVPSEYCVSIHSVLSRCHFCPFWACHLETKCTKWPTWAYPLCSAVSHTVKLGYEFEDLQKLRWLTAFDVFLAGLQRDVVELVETRISCDGTLVVYWARKIF